MDTLPIGTVWKDQNPVFEPSGVTFKEISEPGEPLKRHEYRFTDNTFEVNFGQDRVKYSVKLAATIESIDGDGGNDKILGSYESKNKVVYSLNGVDHGREAWVSSQIPRDPDEQGLEHQNFKKTTLGSSIQVAPGATVAVPFTFTGKDIDLASSWIIDYVDPKVFGSYAEYEDSLVISGSVNGAPLIRWTHSDEGGNLKLTVRPEDVGKLNGNKLDSFSITATLTTKAIEGRDSLWISNSAELMGSAVQYTLKSSTSTVGTSRGGELEVRKSIFDDAPDKKDWVNNLRVNLNPDGSLVLDEFVYRIQLIAHGDFAGGAILPVRDFLPAEADFLSFLNSVSDTTTGRTAMSFDKGKLTAKLTDVNGQTVILIEQVNGQTIGSNLDIELLFKVKLNDSFKADAGIVNKIGSSSATIVPSNSFPFSIQKLDSEDPDNYPIDDPDARFILFQMDGEEERVVVDDIFVVNGQLMVLDKDTKTLKVPTVEVVGEYYLREVKAPKGYKLSDRVLTIMVSDAEPVGSGKFLNDPIPSYAIGDYVWIDKNSDGLHTAGESPLAGVVVTISKVGSEEPIKDVFGNEIPQSVTTGADGLYSFDNLPAGEYQIEFTLTDDQKKLYSFTEQDKQPAPTDKGDSDADVSTGLTATIQLGPENAQLVNKGKYNAEHKAQEIEARNGINPTWDAGVVYRSVSVGDYVWLDHDRDGVQGTSTDETPIKNVVLEILGPDGAAAKDVFGAVVPSTVTDDKGFYTFDNLPVLDADESYTVRIVETDDRTIAALAGLMPTKAGQGSRDKDSSNWEATSEGLTEDRDRDSTLDFGFVAKSYAVGDYVWVDTNRDGLQGDVKTEPVLENVTVVLKRIVDGVAKDALDVLGQPVGSKITDDGGCYLFDNLPAGDYQVQFILNEEDAKKYTFTALESKVENAAQTGSDSNAQTDGWTKLFPLNEGSPDRITAAEYGKDSSRQKGLTQRGTPVWS